MKKHTLCMRAMPALLLAFGLILAGCDTGTGGNTGAFVAVTDITGVPTAAIMNYPQPLSGTVEPSDATNRTIVWSGNNVSGGDLTAPSAGTYTVTATIENGAPGETPYTQNFDIRVYDAGSGDEPNPFGDDANPYVWAMDDKGGEIYATIKDSTWESVAEGDSYNSGTYTRIGGRAILWEVGQGGEAGTTGLAIITGEGKFRVANFANQYSDMNGTFTKLNTGLTLGGTWITSTPSDNFYAKIVASSGYFTEYISLDGSSWREQAKGTYPENTNPAICTITHANTNVFTNNPDTSWVAWDNLSSGDKNNVGGSETFAVIVYPNKCETYGLVLQKQP
jgi:hypothetical protein